MYKQSNTHSQEASKDQTKHVDHSHVAQRTEFTEGPTRNTAPITPNNNEKVGARGR